jgi:hypothetical protein
VNEYDADPFFALVSQMRAAQKKYFRTRNQDDLEDSKRLERDVDRIIKANTAGPWLFAGFPGGGGS